jgi:agmatine deiminase
MIADWDANGVFLADMLQDRYPSVFALLRETLVSHGVEVRLLSGVRDIWAKDYCPIQVAPDQFVKFRYDPDYLKPLPNLRTGDEVVRLFDGLGQCVSSPIVLDGGNVVSSRTKAVLTDKIYKHNRDRTRSELRDDLQRLLHVQELAVVPKEPYDWIGHSDGMVRFVDEDTVLANDYALVYPAFGPRLLKPLLRNNLNVELLPYFSENKSVRDESAVGCYMNFLRTKHVVVAPIFNHKLDEPAINKLKAVFSDVPVIPLECTELARKGGVLNCISASFRADPPVDRC